METTKTAIIRQYAGDDFMDVSYLVKEFYKEAIEEYGLKCEIDQVNKVINDNKSEILVMEMDGKVVGLIAGMLLNYPLQKAKIFQEIMWYVSKDYRRYGISLLRELERRCKERGIHTVIMVAMGSSMSAKLDRLYRMSGYRILETHYVKGIG